MNDWKPRVIARYHGVLPSKFGIPRQSGLAAHLQGEIVFEPPFRSRDSLRGLEEFSHIWLLWGFSAVVHDNESWSPTVRPPRLGGNERVGVFATRSPFRPNPIGLSCVRLLSVDCDGKNGPLLRVEGADLMDTTPIYDIKPYIVYADSVPQAVSGFAQTPPTKLHVDIPTELENTIPATLRESLRAVLELDPRPSFHTDSDRVYGMNFADRNIRFSVRDQVVTVLSIETKK